LAFDCELQGLGFHGEHEQFKPNKRREIGKPNNNRIKEE
jgi:hypothetical protein